MIARHLDAGVPFSSLSMRTVAHGDVVLPNWFGENWGVLLIYRASW